MNDIINNNKRHMYENQSKKPRVLPIKRSLHPYIKKSSQHIKQNISKKDSINKQYIQWLEEKEQNKNRNEILCINKISPKLNTIKQDLLIQQTSSIHFSSVNKQKDVQQQNIEYKKQFQNVLKINQSNSSGYLKPQMQNNVINDALNKKNVESMKKIIHRINTIKKRQENYSSALLMNADQKNLSVDKCGNISGLGREINQRPEKCKIKSYEQFISEGDNSYVQKEIIGFKKQAKFKTRINKQNYAMLSLSFDGNHEPIHSGPSITQTEIYRRNSNIIPKNELKKYSLKKDKKSQRHDIPAGNKLQSNIISIHNWSNCTDIKISKKKEFTHKNKNRQQYKRINEQKNASVHILKDPTTRSELSPGIVLIDIKANTEPNENLQQFTPWTKRQSLIKL